MEYDGRHLQPVKIGMTSVEMGRDRFTQDKILHLPQISRWRNNLTALSQRYNLYFVALEAQIFVYQPKFPFQTLEQRPSLTIPTAIAEPGAQGYIDTRCAHTINHIIVGDLGTEEILVVATDSGNVAAYHTKAILDAIGKEPYKYSTEAKADFVGLRAFFSHWVFESAWGLAIHKNARMIAVSANTPHYVDSVDEHAKVTVFAFALTSHAAAEKGRRQEDFDKPSEHSQWKEWVPNSTQVFQSDRSQNYRIVLSGHVANVPSISFVNSDYDKDGSWLLSTDIGGRMKMWRIWGRQCWKTWDFSLPVSPTAHYGDMIDRGWLVLALDPAAFRSADTLEEFSGWSKWVKYHPHTETKESFDITTCVSTRTPNSSQVHPAFGTAEGDASADDDDDDGDFSEASWSDDDGFVDTDLEDIPSERGHGDVEIAGDDDEAMEDSDAGIDDGTGRTWEEERLAEGISVEEADQALDMLSASEDEREAAMLQSPSEDDLDHFDENSPPRTQAYIEGENQTEQPTLELPIVTGPGSNDDFNTGLDAEHAIRFDHSKKRSRQSQSYKAFYEAHMATKARRITPTVQPIPTIPAIHCSATHIRLLNVPTSETPHIFCGSALKQTLPRQMELSSFAHFDRMNMMQYIPELGIVVIATQLGRCAVCTLTRKHDTGTLGFRVDWILPTMRQEKAGLRPTAPLLGIAAGPIQGRQVGEESGSSNAASGSDLEDEEENRIASSVFEDDAPDMDSSNSDNSDSNHDFPLVLSPSATSKGRAVHARRSTKHHEDDSFKTPNRPRGSSSYSSKSKPRAESWRGIENSRRHRLMLTYYDQTIMTYEIWREAAEIGIEGYKNYRNRPSMLV